MITFLRGKPGSGKSVHTAILIKQALRRGQNVIANFPFRDDLIKPKGKRPKGQFIFVHNKYFRMFNKNPKYFWQCPTICLAGFADNFHKFSDTGRCYESQTILVFDECGSIWNSRTWQVPGRQEWLDFYSEHRKYGFDIYCISQFERQIDRQIREQFEYDIEHRKLSNFKTFGKLLSFFVGGDLFVAIKRWYGVKSKKENKISSQFFIGTKSIYKLFNTSQRFSRE